VCLLYISGIVDLLPSKFNVAVSVKITNLGYMRTDCVPMLLFHDSKTGLLCTVPNGTVLLVGACV